MCPNFSSLAQTVWEIRTFCKETVRSCSLSGSLLIIDQAKKDFTWCKSMVMFALNLLRISDEKSGDLTGCRCLEDR